MRADDVFTDAGSALHRAALGIQGRFLARLGIKLVQLGHSVAQKVFLGPNGGKGRFGQGQITQGIGARAPCSAQARQIKGCETVQQLAVAARI